ncbi:DUF1983 domain-containing protein [Escherichia coli]|uniref:DUF1983 domain-containing protein n=2 Tax=Escherichia coli TaxID=562 RepID=UPI003CC9724D
MTTTDQKLGDQEATIQQIQKVQTDTSNNLNSMWAVKLQQMQDGRLYIAGIGAGIENTPDGMQSQVLLAADRIAMVNPANGNTTPLFVAQGDQLFLNEVFISRATIDFAEITGVLRSSGFEVRGQGGWDLSRELNCFRVDDENNVIRVRMGRLF